MQRFEKFIESKAAKNHWHTIGLKQHHGIAVPLFSLHSELSCGIGEYLDLQYVVDFCVQVGMDVIQLLPLNDTGGGKSPYSALSSNALHPIYLSLYALEGVEEVPEYHIKLQTLRKWSRTKNVHYAVVYEFKRIFLEQYLKAQAQEIKKKPSFQKFCETQEPWLYPYVIFKTLKEVFPGKSWRLWPREIQVHSKQKLFQIEKKYPQLILKHQIIQFLCMNQMAAVKKYANSQGVLIKGDLPILLDKESADVWYHRKYFILDYDAGCPPDLYSPDGQHWGFPLYDWDVIFEDQFSFWKTRLNLASHFYDLYRLDHAVGFYRIWGLKDGKPPTQGEFFPKEKKQWLKQGKQIMTALLENSTMLPIAEDLGSVPNYVKDSLQSLGIPGTKVMRWEKNFKHEHFFIPLSEYPPISMTTVSTHDSDTLQLWWRHSPHEAKTYCALQGWKYTPFLSLERQFDLLKQSHHSKSLIHINLFNEYLALFPQMVSIDALDERINIPGKILSRNWTYRFRLNIEKMLDHQELKETMKQIVG